MKKIIIIASIALSLTSCLGLHTYRIKVYDQVRFTVCQLCEETTVSDWTTYKVGDVIPGPTYHIVTEVIK